MHCQDKVAIYHIIWHKYMHHVLQKWWRIFYTISIPLKDEMILQTLHFANDQVLLANTNKTLNSSVEDFALYNNSNSKIKIGNTLSRQGCCQSSVLFKICLHHMIQKRWRSCCAMNTTLNDEMSHFADNQVLSLKPIRI